MTNSKVKLSWYMIFDSGKTSGFLIQLWCNSEIKLLCHIVFSPATSGLNSGMVLLQSNACPASGYLDVQYSLYFTPSILSPPLIIRPPDFLPKGQFSVLNDLHFKTTCNIRPHFLVPLVVLNTGTTVPLYRLLERTILRPLGFLE